MAHRISVKFYAQAECFIIASCRVGASTIHNERLYSTNQNFTLRTIDQTDRFAARLFTHTQTNTTHKCNTINKTEGIRAEYSHIRGSSSSARSVYMCIRCVGQISIRIYAKRVICLYAVVGGHKNASAECGILPTTPAQN